MRLHVKKDGHKNEIRILPQYGFKSKRKVPNNKYKKTKTGRRHKYYQYYLLKNKTNGNSDDFGMHNDNIELQKSSVKTGVEGTEKNRATKSNKEKYSDINDRNSEEIKLIHLDKRKVTQNSVFFCVIHYFCLYYIIFVSLILLYFFFLLFCLLFSAFHFSFFSSILNY